MAIKKKTFASEAKTIMNKYKTRLGEKFDKGDALALEAMNQELTALQQKQEKTRMDRLVKEGVVEAGNEFAYGGDLMKYVKGGTLNLNNSKDVSALPFAQNTEGAPYANQSLATNAGFAEANDPNAYMEGTTQGNILPQKSTQTATPDFTDLLSTLDQEEATGMAVYEDPLGNEDLTQAIPINSEDRQEDRQAYESRVPWFGAVAQGAGALLGNRNIDFEDIDAQEVNPNLVDYSREREQFGRDRDITNSIVRKGAAQRGSRAGVTGNIIAGSTGAQRVHGRQFSKSLQGEQNQNAQIGNQSEFFNAQQRTRAGAGNRQNMLINEQGRTNRIQGALGSVTGYGKDLMSSDQYDQMINMMMADKDYGLLQDEGSKLRKALGITNPSKVKFYNPNANLSTT